MEKYSEVLTNLSWQDLLQQVSAILSRDAKTLESNVNYYKRLLADSNADKEHLNRLFEKLQLDKLRYTYFSELFFRLDENSNRFVIMSLESCIQQETQIQSHRPKDWAATVHCEAGEIKVHFMALSYYQ